MNILITGGNGYVAKGLYAGLKSLYNVTRITRSDFDLTNYAQTCQWFADKHFDVVIHTAVVGGNRLKEEDDTIIRQNLDMYYNLINNKDHFDRFISFGSGAELDWPTTPYGFSKRIIAESMLRKDYCLNLRIFAVFDHNELDRRFIKSNILRYINQEDMVVYEDKPMDFFYMEDLVNLVSYHIKQKEWLHRVLDCRYVKSYTLHEIAQMINRLGKHRVGIDVVNREGKPYTGNYIGLLIPLVGLEDGISRTYHNLII